jgi:molybdenum cofactor cytidylyltransferase
VTWSYVTPTGYYIIGNNLYYAQALPVFPQDQDMQKQPSTAAIILAAGSSSRMGAGQHKLLLPLGDRPVLAHVIEATLASHARPIIIVLGHRAAQVRASISHYATHPAITLVENNGYTKGMSTSLRVGLQALTATSSKTEPSHYPNGALVLLGDQPLMTPSILDTLIATKQATEKRIIAPLYNGKRGNPVLFDASLFPELMEVTGDEGGRSVIERHRQDLVTVEVGDTVAPYDVDTWDAYQQVVTEWHRQHGC